jgi:alkylation response protein AidB-like acyl-CoA dehydrogenase
VTGSFPDLDPVGPAVDGLAIPGRELLRRIADAAAATDTGGVPRSTIDELAAAGLLGSALQPAAAQRELAELLSGCDATTWFCWVQHQTPLRTLEGGIAGLRASAPPALADGLLPGLRTGRLLGAVAFAHVRRPGPPNPVATRVSGGWRFDGTLDWVTSWDIADVVMVMAQGAGADGDRLVCAYVPGGHAESGWAGVDPGPVLDLVSMGGTHTRPVRLSGVVVPDDRIGAVLDRREWLAADDVRTADANPAAFGVTRGAIAELRALADLRADAGLRDLAERLTDRCRRVRARAYGLADAEAAPDERRATRAAALDLAVLASTAVVVARSGAGMRRGCSAERRVREAMFLLVQAQTAATRAASVALLTARAAAEPDLQ